MVKGYGFHTPVLVREVLELLDLQPGMTVLDCTLGGGGHSEQMALAISPGGSLIALDRDEAAIAEAKVRLEPLRSQVAISLLHIAFANLRQALITTSNGSSFGLDACLFDLGVSSYQLDSAVGFSFRRDELLDGRMDRTGSEPTIAELLRSITEEALTKALLEYGEEPFARKISRQIIKDRQTGNPVETTGHLVSIVERAVPRSAWPRDKHVATKVFQALRILCNQELEQFEIGLNAAIDSLKPGGRVAVISWHSLEDRICKSVFAKRAGKAPSPSGYSIAALSPLENSVKPELEIITRKPVVPDQLEINSNHRARTARLRVAKRI